MVRVALLIVLFFVLSRALWRLFDGVVEGITGRPPQTRIPQRGVQMVRDPVCGTFVVPERAITIGEGRARVFFCSEACRDAFRRGRGTAAGSRGSVGRTA